MEFTEQKAGPFGAAGAYGHTSRPFAGPGMLAVQIEERRAELAFLRAVWPQGAGPINNQLTTSAPSDGSVGAREIDKTPPPDRRELECGPFGSTQARRASSDWTPPM